MKREIFCLECGHRLGLINPVATVSGLDAAMAAQEKIVKVYGKLRVSCRCDFCAKDLTAGTQACCQSIVGIGQQYYKWEHEYIHESSKH